MNQKNLEKICADLNIQNNDKLFLERVFKTGLTKYIKRLKQYKFTNLDKVLDAGCGFGQWSLALAQLNKEVYSCDADPKRVAFLKKVVLENELGNLSVREASIDKLPYDNETFDAVFAYSVLPFVDWKQSLAELTRVLKNRGILYVNANDWGWYQYLWKSAHNVMIDYDPQKIASEVLANTLHYQRGGTLSFPTHLLIEKDELIERINALELKVLSWAEEGGSFLENKDFTPFIIGHYKNNLAVYEVLAQKESK